MELVSQIRLLNKAIEMNEIHISDLRTRVGLLDIRIARIESALSGSTAAAAAAAAAGSSASGSGSAKKRKPAEDQVLAVSDKKKGKTCICSICKCDRSDKTTSHAYCNQEIARKKKAKEAKKAKVAAAAGAGATGK